MSPTTTPDNKQPDFRNYRWVPGALAGDSACISIDRQAGVWLGLKGWDKRTSANGYIAVRMNPAGLQALRDLVECALAAATVGSYEAALEAIQAA
jgi:hypothetical protein